MIDFTIVNDIEQPLKECPGYNHIASIRRRNKEYVVFKNNVTGDVYMEQVEDNIVNLRLKKIEDDKEWSDLYRFCKAAGLLNIDGYKKLLV